MENKHRFEMFIGILAIISIILIALETVMSLSTRSLLLLYIIDLVICAVFAWDFMHRFSLTDDKMKFLKRNGFEVLAIIPVGLLYILGMIPAISIALRSLRLIRVFRIIIVISRLSRLFISPGTFLKRSNMLMLSSITISIIFISALAVFYIEYDMPNAQITRFSDAVWWSLSTVTTVGFGDVVPYSMAGRIIGMILMIVGIGITTSLISQVSATLVESRLNLNNNKKDLKSTLLAEIKEKLDNIDRLSDTDVSLLMQMIQLLRTEKGKQ